MLTLQGSGTPANPGNPFNPGNSGTPGALTPNPASLSFQYPGPTSQTVTVTTTGGTAHYTATVQVSIAAITWLSVSAPSGPVAAGTPSTFQVNVSPQGLQPGTYPTSILLHPDNGTPDVIIPLRLVVQPPVSSVLTVSPPTINLSSIAGAGAISGGLISISATGPAVQFTSTVNGANWLTVAPASGATPAQAVVSVNASTLPAGFYSGTIVISAPAASNSPQVVTVNLTVQPSQNITLSTTNLTFSSPADGTAPPPQTVMASSSNGVLSFNATALAVSPPGVNWLVVTPSSGSAGNSATSLTVSVNPAGLSAGTYSGLITLTAAGAGNSPQAVSVTLIVNPRPAPVPTTILNAASRTPGAVAPGEVITISGSNLGPAPGVVAPLNAASLQSVLSEAQVTFDNIPAPLLFVSDTRITTIVPYAIAGRATTRMAVVYRNTASAAITLNVADAAPGIFALNPAGEGAILNEDGTGNTPLAPAPKGTTIVLFGTGEGVSSPLSIDGRIIPADDTQATHPVQQVSVTIGGVPAQVQYAGSAPGLISGVLKVSVVVPDDAPSGSAIPVVLTVGTVDSPPVTMAVE
jgi:uncharacterized protein (TIGR03437 family)